MYPGTNLEVDQSYKGPERQLWPRAMQCLDELRGRLFILLHLQISNK